jgi:DNA-binding CsgD family transcriptional regulator
MTIKILPTNNGSSQANGNAATATRRPGAGYTDELTKIRLRDALAREDALLRERDELRHRLSAWREAAAGHLAGLTPREQQIMDMVLAGHPSKNIAADLNISQRTVENHRAAVMKKTGAKCLPALARLAMVAAWNDASALHHDAGALGADDPDHDTAVDRCGGATESLTAAHEAPAADLVSSHDRAVAFTNRNDQMREDA